MRSLTALLAGLLSLSISPAALATELTPGDAAPAITAKTQSGEDFDLASRKGKWTVLFFYPKAGTPGCTKQACAFRDSVKKIRDQGADVYGISSDDVEDQAKFHAEHKLTFTLLADPDGTAVRAYGAKMPILNLSKRWTFIIDPELKIRQVDRDVDPALDAQKVADSLALLRKG
ncbi:MAG: peroxiredoxin [Bdellovibrionales bacterium]|nr:peroxiredoxin [Bdellovibrionales bacterium]